MCDGTGLAEALLALEGLKVLDVVPAGELTVEAETTAVVVGCGRRLTATRRPGPRPIPGSRPEAC